MCCEWFDVIRKCLLLRVLHFISSVYLSRSLGTTGLLIRLYELRLITEPFNVLSVYE